MLLEQKLKKEKSKWNMLQFSYSITSFLQEQSVWEYSICEQQVSF